MLKTLCMCVCSRAGMRAYEEGVNSDHCARVLQVGLSRGAPPRPPALDPSLISTNIVD